MSALLFNGCSAKQGNAALIENTASGAAIGATMQAIGGGDRNSIAQGALGGALSMVVGMGVNYLMGNMMSSNTESDKVEDLHQVNK
jgi:hypothetical protein